MLTFLIVVNCFAADITLRWNANTENDLAGYNLYYRTDTSVPYDVATPIGEEVDQGFSPIIIQITDPNGLNYIPNVNPEFVITGLDLYLYDYYLVLTAYDNEVPENESGYSNEVNTIGLTTPKNLIASVISQSQIDLDWDALSIRTGVIGYKVYRDGVEVAIVTSNNYSDYTVSVGITYTYTVTSFGQDPVIKSPLSNSSSAMTTDTEPPAPPQNLSLEVISNSQINLNWLEPADNIGVVRYDIYRNDSYIDYTTSTIYSDTGLMPSTLYTYYVVAYDAGGNSTVMLNSVSATTHDSSTNDPPTTSPLSIGGGSSGGGCFINTLMRR